MFLNGETKPTGWTRTSTAPLDPNYGAGELNVYNSWQELRGGDQAVSSSATENIGGHVPSAASNLRGVTGWDLGSIKSTATKDAVNNYFVTAPSQAKDTLTATLTWERQNNRSSINNLDLFLYDVTRSTLSSESISTVDNVEQLYVPGLNPNDTYDIQVWKEGGSTGSSGVVSLAESYALAYTITSTALVPGDANGDGIVDVTDLGIVGSHWQQTNQTWSTGTSTAMASLT